MSLHCMVQGRVKRQLTEDGQHKTLLVQVIVKGDRRQVKMSVDI